MCEGRGIQMNEKSEVLGLSLLLERKLNEHGVLDQEKLIVISLPSDLRDRMDGLIDNIAELQGLLEVARAVRAGEAVSQPVVAAARLMLEEACEALMDDEPSAIINRAH
jgi:hypothetical protein